MHAVPADTGPAIEISLEASGTGQSDVSPLTISQGDPTMTPIVKLTVVQSSAPGKEYVFRDHTVCRLGRAADCLVKVPSDMAHSDVSRHHCLLDIDPPTIWVR